MRQKRAELANDPAYVQQVLTAGAERARERASQTLAEVKRAMKVV